MRMILRLVRFKHSNLAPLVEEKDNDEDPDGQYKHNYNNLFFTDGEVWGGLLFQLCRISSLAPTFILCKMKMLKSN